jgi:hypothetical protein
VVAVLEAVGGERGPAFLGMPCYMAQPAEWIDMSPIAKETVLVFTAYRDGLEEGIDLDRETLVRTHKIRPGSTRKYVRVSEEEVGVIVGRLLRWWEEPGGSGCKRRITRGSPGMS